MKRIKNILLALAVMLSIFIGLWLGQDNPDTVNVVLLGFQLPPLPLGVWLLVALVVGIVLGLLASLPLLIRANAENRRLKRQQS